MSLAFITVTANYTTAGGWTGTSPVPGSVTFTPSSQIIDSAGRLIMPAVSITMTLTAGVGSVSLLCTDNAGLNPSGWYWVVTQNVGTAPITQDYFIPSTLGASVDLAQLVAAVPAPPVYGYYGLLASPNVNEWTSTQAFNGPVSVNDGLTIASVAIDDPPGGTTEYLRADGTWDVPGGGGGGSVTSVFGRTGAVVATSGDYSFSLISGTAALTQGGTGQTSAQAAMDALAGGTTTGEYLRGNGTNVVLSAIQVADVPTLNQSTTGTASNVTGTVAIANGGTGQTAQQAAINALTGTQSSGRYLRSDGTNATLSAIQSADVPTLNQNTTGTAANVTGMVALANGGTGQTSAQSAMNALAGGTNSAQYLRGNGTNVVLSAIQGSDVPTLNQNTTGTAANVTGTVAIANGGTGQTARQAAINALTGTQSGGTYLRSDGTNATLSAIQAGDVPTLNQSTTGNAASVGGITVTGTPTAGQVLTATSGTAADWQASGSAPVTSVFGRTGAVVAASNDYSFSQISGTAALTQGGTGQTSAAAAYNALSPMTTVGDIEYESGANTAARLAGNTSATKNFLTQTGTGSASAAPAWGTIALGDLPAGTVTTFNQSALRLGLVSETTPIYSCSASNTLTSGTLFLMLLAWPANKTLTHLSVYVTTLGVTSSGTNNIGLYTSSGTLITTTGDMTTGFETLGWQEGTLSSPQTPTSDTVYYVGVLSHFSGTAMHIEGFNMVSAIGAINGVYPTITFATQTNQATFTPSSGTPNSGAYWIGAR